MKFNELWRPVETGDADRLEFWRGGNKRLVLRGVIYLASSVLMGGLFTVALGVDFLAILVGSVRSGFYAAAVSIYFWCGLMLSMFVFSFLMLGAWMIFGTTRLALDRLARTISREYPFCSGCLSAKTYQLATPSALEFSREARFHVPAHFLILRGENGKRSRIVIIPRKFAADGWAMAERMAGFLGIPLLDQTAT